LLAFVPSRERGVKKKDEIARSGMKGTFMLRQASSFAKAKPDPPTAHSLWATCREQHERVKIKSSLTLLYERRE
jgi:hypothetical protein